MVKFPVRCSVKAQSREGIQTPWNAQANSLSPISVAIPTDFGGSGNGYSPEDFFALALLNCVIATFKVYCEKSKIHFQELAGRSTLTVDQQAGEDQIWIKHIEVFIDVTGASDPQKIRLLLDNAIRDCAVSHSIKSGKTFHVSVT